jgi:signal transduction histidine kinase
MDKTTIRSHEPTTARVPPGRRILVVDDNRDFADGLETILTLEGYEVAVAYSARQARAVVEDFDARVAILDYRLGQETGVDLVAPLRRSRPDLVCILATAYADLDSAVHALRHGIYEYIRKSFHVEELLSTLERCFEKLRLEEEKRAAEQALGEARRMAAVAQVAGGVAHHVNNLLAVMQGHLELLQDHLADDPGPARSVDKALQAIERAAGITHGLIAFTRHQTLRPELADVSALALEAEDALRAEADGILEIEWHAAAGLWPVRVDRARLKEALFCLVRNAVEAAASGGRLTIATANQEIGDNDPAAQVPAGRYVVLTVSDDGAGMAPDVVERAFEPFYSARGLAERVGLGLSIVQGFAKQSGGEAVITSRPGQGTTVALYLPCVEAAKDT